MDELLSSFMYYCGQNISLLYPGQPLLSCMQQNLHRLNSFASAFFIRGMKQYLWPSDGRTFYLATKVEKKRTAFNNRATQHIDLFYLLLIIFLCVCADWRICCSRRYRRENTRNIDGCMCHFPLTECNIYCLHKTSIWDLFYSKYVEQCQRTAVKRKLSERRAFWDALLYSFYTNSGKHNSF